MLWNSYPILLGSLTTRDEVAKGPRIKQNVTCLQKINNTIINDF